MAAVCLLLALTVGCSGPPTTSERIGTATLVQLADRLDAAEIDSGGSPASAGRSLRWSFDQPRPEWRPFSAQDVSRLAAVDLETIEDGVRLTFRRAPTSSWVLTGGLAIDLDDLRLADWETVLVRARSSDRFAGITAAYNLDEKRALPSDMQFFHSADEIPPVFNDGSAQVYAIPLRPRRGIREDESLDSLAVLLGTPEPAAIDILEIALVPRGAAFQDDYGVRSVVRDGETRRTLFAHTPARLSYQVDVPSGARLDVGLGASVAETVTYRINVDVGDGSTQVLLEETVEGGGAWRQSSADLASFAGQSVRLTLDATSDRDGTAALWGAPILSGGAVSALPNVIFYVIDGAGADLMSVYGYERPTTPFLEELASEGAVFDWAYSNSTWTQPSTVSFMTSLQHSVLGGLRRGVHSTAVPPEAVTMAEHLRAAGYQTASFTSNPNAGRLIGLERGVDLMRDGATEHHSTSSKELHERFWSFREHFPGGPYWVHFQTSDVHEPNQPRPPFAGTFADKKRRGQLMGWDMQLMMFGGRLFGTTSIRGYYDGALKLANIERQAYYSVRRDLYDETMMHQDGQLRSLVERLKAAGEWENTLLIVASDHGHPAGTYARFGRGLIEPQPEFWQGAMFDAYSSRVPMIWVWPGEIEGGQRFAQPVSMIDVLPTLLDLLELPQPEMLQGQSLEPLLSGQAMDVRPVIFDEFRVDDETGEMIGNLEIVDGRWGASLEIRQAAGGVDSELGRHEVPVGGRWGARHPFSPQVPRLLLYDLDNDPFATKAVNEEHPDLVERYRRMLLIQWKAHLALAQQFSGEAEEVPLSPEQLEQLKALGYIQ